MSKQQLDEWYTYLLICADETIYTGITKNIEKRVYAHNNLKSGAKYTRTRRPVKLLKSFGPLSKSEAISLEIKIKKLKRKDKLLL